MFPKYSEYVDSGLPWLGKIPSHWQTKPFFSHFEERKESNLGMKESNLLSLSYGRIIRKDINTLDGLLPASFETYQVVYPGDLVFRLTDLQNDKRSLRSALVNQKGIITSAYLAAIPKGISSRFSHYLFRSYDLQKVFYSMGGGLRQGMKYSDMRRLEVLIPPQSEQRTIARFLDHETAKIDALIAEQQRLIELLKEKRQAVISHAVTKGLDPDVPMKDSGVEWLGEVPAHWEVCPAKRLYEFVTSGSRGWAEYYSDEGDLFFRIGNLSRESINPKLDSIQFVYPPAEGEGQRARIREGDILISITADLGSVCAASEQLSGAYVSQHVALARPNRRVESSRWLAFFILSTAAKSQLLQSGYGGTKVQLSLEDIKDLVIAVPPSGEQVDAAKRLDSQIKAMDDLIEVAHKGNELLRERRSALISSAVTGKIDVRDWQSSEPAEEAEHAHPAEEAATYE